VHLFPARMLGHAARAITSSLFSRQLQYITVKRLDVADAPITAADRDIECLVVDSPDALEAVAPEIPATFRDSVDELRKRVAQGCVVCLARRPREDGTGKEVVGYELAERGVFSALGRRNALPAEVIFSHYAEVLPACRGQRIHRRLFATRDAYFRERGGKILCGVVAPKNRASLQALGRAGHVVAGTVERIALFRVLVLCDTPWDRIQDALQAAGGTVAHASLREALRQADRRHRGGHRRFRPAAAFGAAHRG
jgi:GNAT superfamily N-acetyltransferase